MTPDDEARHDRASLVELQRLLLPPTLPAIGCTEAAVHYRAHNDAFRVGGDWYDMIDRPDDRVVAVVGDIVGHGVQHISAMGQLRAASNALGRVLPEPGDIADALSAFATHVPGGEFASAAVLMLDGTTTAKITLAGHPPPLLVRAAGGWAAVESPPGPLLGLPGERPTTTFRYEVDDVLVLYTDGLLGTGQPDAVLDRIGTFVADRIDDPCRSIAAEIAAEFGTDADDDLVVVVLRPRNHRSPDYRLRPQVAPTVTFE